MKRVGEQRLGRCLLDQAAGVHDHDPVGDLGDDAEVVADKQHGQPCLALYL